MFVNVNLVDFSGYSMDSSNGFGLQWKYSRH